MIKITKLLFQLFLLYLVCSSLSYAQPGSLDTTLNSTDKGFGYGDGPEGGVTCIAKQPDGKIVLAGMRLFNSKPHQYTRLNPDGTEDTTFHPGVGPEQTSGIYVIAIQPDGKLLFGGSFYKFNNKIAYGIVRLDSTGATDTSFKPAIQFQRVASILLQADGKMVVAGKTGLIPNKNIVRLNYDGSLDSSFINDTNIYEIYKAIRQSDGKVIFSGGFFQGAKLRTMGRLHVNGALDTTFVADTITDTRQVDRMLLQPDGKVIISNRFEIAINKYKSEIWRLNPQGSLDTSFSVAAGPNASITSMILQPDGKIICGGTFSNFDGQTRNGLVRLHSSGKIDTSFNPDSSFFTVWYIGYNTSVACLEFNMDDSSVLIGGYSGYHNGDSRTNLVKVNKHGASDNSFLPATGVIGRHVQTLLTQPDGKIIMSGWIHGYFNERIRPLTRIKPDGHLDTSYKVGLGPYGEIMCKVLQPDGKLIIAGNFTRFDGVQRRRIARLNTDGSLDTSFNPGQGANLEIRAIAIQADGKIYLGGRFDTFAGIATKKLVRLNTDGSIDLVFPIGITGSSIDAIVIAQNGKTYIGGVFSKFNGVARTSVARLNTDGSIDLTFNPGAGSDGVHQLLVQQDGKLILFSSKTIRRLNINGAIDAGFTTSTANNASLLFPALQSDGKIVVGGNFTMFNGQPIQRLVRLNTDGTLDSDFNTQIAADSSIMCIAIQNDKLIIGGYFLSYKGIGRNRIARINLQHTPVFTFTGTGDWNNPANWIGGQVPPNPVLPGMTVNITPVNGGSCIHNGTLTISAGATLNVPPGVNFIVNGNLVMQ